MITVLKIHRLKHNIREGWKKNAPVKFNFINNFTYVLLRMKKKNAPVILHVKIMFWFAKKISSVGKKIQLWKVWGSIPNVFILGESP